jgi:hypothetical protein
VIVIAVWSEAGVGAACVGAIVGGERTVFVVDGPPNLFAGADGPGHRLDEWLAASRADDAARARARERFLRRTAPEDATFGGILLDLAEAGRTVAVSTTTGRRHRGTLRAVGADVAVLRAADGRHVLLAHRGIAAVRPEGRAAADGDREVGAAGVGATLGDVLAVVAEDAPRVLVVATAGGDGLAGELTSVGRDVLAVRLDGDGRQVAYVPLDAVAEVTLA